MWEQDSLSKTEHALVQKKLQRHLYTEKLIINRHYIGIMYDNGLISCIISRKVEVYDYKNKFFLPKYALY